MKQINDLCSIVRLDGNENEIPLVEAFPQLKPLDGRKGIQRTPIIFLVDGSRTMLDYIGVLNSCLQRMHALLQQRNSGLQLSNIVDMAVLVFARMGSDPQVIHYQKEFDLVGDTPFALSRCVGSTPLGEAMLHAYVYARLRKEQYKREGFLYSQPIVILISDLGENSSASYRIDGQEYGGGQLFEAMAELYVEQMKGTRKQYTFVIPLGAVKKDREAALTGLDFRPGLDKTIGDVLDRVIEEYIASARESVDGRGVTAETVQQSGIYIGGGMRKPTNELDEFTMLADGAEEVTSDNIDLILDNLFEGTVRADGRTGARRSFDRQPAPPSKKPSPQKDPPPTDPSHNKA